MWFCLYYVLYLYEIILYTNTYYEFIFISHAVQNEQCHESWLVLIQILSYQDTFHMTSETK